MIAHLRGILSSIGEDWIILDVSGVGYLVSCSLKTLRKLPQTGENVTLLTQMLVSENSFRLIGFWEKNEQEWFRLLNTVQGVGTKAALAILSTLSGEELTQALMHQDKAMIARTPGIGPKLAQRLMSELKDKPLPSDGIFLEEASFASNQPLPSSAAQDATSVLLNLGYTQPHIGRALKSVLAKHSPQSSPTSEMLIRQALKELSGNVLRES